MRRPPVLVSDLLLFWHKRLSPALPGACRFEPTCSVYAADAFRTHGLARGLLLSLGRLARCQPWGGSGWDPCPSRGPGQSKKGHP